MKQDLIINNNEIQPLTIDKTETPSLMLLSTDHLIQHVLQNKNTSKLFHIAGGFNLNLLDRDKSKKVQKFFNLIYRNGVIPTTNKATGVTQKTTTGIDHIHANSFTETVFKASIFKSGIFGNFRSFSVSSSTKQANE